MKTAALIVAAGRGSRADVPDGLPKQYVRLGGLPVLAHTLRVFEGHPAIDLIAVVRHADDDELCEEAAAAAGVRLAIVAIGGATRQASVRSGLEALAALAPRHVLIHDAARPFVDAGVIGRVVAALDAHSGAIAALPVVDTLKRAGEGSRVAGTLSREGLWRAQTPQGFHFQAILDAHRRVAAVDDTFTDDAAVAEWAGLDVALVSGSESNTKITTAEDLRMAEMRLATPPPLEMRTGQGFDVHRFADGDHVWLCGVRLPHERGLLGHSDADVALHALTDAVLGALGDGDIGQHFPPSDPRWKGAPSHIFLADAARRVAARGGHIVNVDLTILCEAPRIGPHRDVMRARIAEILGLSPDRIGVKATTTEQLGFTGRREGIAALAVAAIMLPLR